MYLDLLTRIKNAQQAKKEIIKVPFSNMDLAVALILVRTGYLESVEKKGRLPKRVIEIKLKYDQGRGAVNGVKFLSKPSRRLYFGYKDLRSVKKNYGLSVLSTPKGIMTNREARREKVGGELLFEIW